MPLEFANVDHEYMKRNQLKREDVIYIQEWLQKQPHIPEMMELEIIFLLHSCKYSIEMTKITIDNYYTMRGLSPELFGKRNAVGMQKVLDNYIAVPLPTPAIDGSKIVFSKLKTDLPSDYEFDDYIKYMDIVLRITLYEEGTFDGLVVVFDATGYGLSHLAKVSPISLKKFLVFLQEALPTELKQLHFLNSGVAMERLYAIMKPFIKKKLLDLIYLHTNSCTEFYSKTLAKEDMPEEYGGSGESLASLHDNMVKKVHNSLDFIEEDEKKVSDESKRVQKSTRVNELFGIEGSFKKLEID